MEHHMSEELYKQMAQSILDGEEDVAAELAQKALDDGIDPLAAITDGHMPGVNEVGDSFACGQAFLPESCWLPSKATSTRLANRWSGRC